MKIISFLVDVPDELSLDEIFEYSQKVRDCMRSDRRFGSQLERLTFDDGKDYNFTVDIAVEVNYDQ